MFVRSHRIVLPLVAAVCMSLVMTSAVRADDHKDLLKVIPADAWGVVMLKSLDQIDARAKLINDLVGLDLPIPVTPMALAPLNLGDTLDMNRPVAVVMLNVQKYGTMSIGDAFVLVVPSKKPKALLEKLAAEELEAGLNKCEIMGEPAFAAKKGKFLIVGPSQEAVTAVVKSKKSVADSLHKARLPFLKKADISISLAPSVVIGAYKDMIMAMLPMLAGPTGGNTQQLEQGIEMMIQIGTLDIAISLTDNGLALGTLVAPIADSDLAKVYASIENDDKSFLTLLPKEQYLLAGGGSSRYSEHAAAFGADKPVSTLLSQPGFGLDVSAEIAKKMDKEALKLIKSLRGYAFSISTFKDTKDGMLGITFVLETKNSKDFVQGMRELWKDANALMEGAKSEDGEDGEDAEDVEEAKEAMKLVLHTPDAEMIAGNKVDTVTINLKELAEASTVDSEVLEMFGKLFGKDFMVRFGAADGKHLVLTFGGGKDRFEQVCKAVKADDGGLSKDAGIVKLSKRLTKPRAGEIYLSADNLANAIKVVMKELGEEEEFPVEIPKIDAPIAFSVAADKGATLYEVLVPVELIKAAKGAYDKFALTSVVDFDEEDDDDDEDDDVDEDDDDEEEEDEADEE